MIGTLTVHYNANYGANLQAYALRKFLEKKTEDEVKVIDYRSDRIRNLYAVRPWDVHQAFPYVSMNLSSIKRFVKMLLNMEGTVIRDTRFRRFRDKYIPMTKTVYDVKSIRNLNCGLIIIGSDQIWNDSITDDKEKAFWGSMKDQNTTVVSYAPSFGRTDISELEKQNIRENIQNFDYITVREPSMIGFLKPCTDKEIHVVCDPVLLLTREEWKTLLIPKKEQYLFVYILQNNPVLIEMAEKAANLLDLKIIIVSSGMKIVPHSGKYYKTVDPCEFLSYLYSAEYIFTNSFHGTVFSVLFNKRFVTLPDTKKPARMLEFLDKCGLSGRIVYHAEDISEKYLQEEIDYDIAREYITDLRNSSILCIEDMLKLKEHNDD